MNRETIFSQDRLYRYTLWREWDCDLLTGCSDDPPNAGEFAMFIGLNPSTADETRDDPTIRRCTDFAKRWGYGSLCMTNLFAWRDTKPENMMKSPEPVGPLNDFYLFELAKTAGIIIAAWGKRGMFLGRSNHIRDLFCEAGFKLHGLRFNNDGSPEHPLYIPAITQPKEWLWR